MTARAVARTFWSWRIWVRSSFVLTCIVLAVCSAPVMAGTPIVPTTTLAIETGNNTSTADSFHAQSNGNAGAGNVSKAPSRSLLYPGSTTNIYAHFMPWFGNANHMNVGYSSADTAQIKKQVNDMISRGIQGLIIDWYGPHFSFEDTVSTRVMQEVETHSGTFVFSIMEDGGQLQSCVQTPGCDVTQAVIDDLNYAYTTYERSPAYMRVNGRPVVFFFDGTSYPVDWTRVRANVSGNPLFVFRNATGFTHAQSDGAFSWVNPSSDVANIGIDYLNNFYSTGLAHSAQHTIGSPYKGFDDSLAAWTQHRRMVQNCGQTWLATMAEVGNYYSTANQLESLQLVTWNDYEEGTEIESGIDNCVSISAGIAGNGISWNISGQETTVDHYTVFISTDGQNLMPLSDFPAGTHTLDLAHYGFDPGSYTLYVKAVGRPSLLNHFSNAVSYQVGSSSQPPIARLEVTPAQGVAPLSVTASTAGSSAPAGWIASTSIDFGDGAVVGVPAGGAATHVYNNPRDYNVRATVTDNLGGTATANRTASVAPAPSVTITVTSRNSGFIMSVHVVVQGYSTHPITQMQLWLDGKLVTQVQSSFLAANLHLRQRTVHHLSATATDSTGATFSATATLPSR